MKVAVDPKLCTGCGICEIVCPEVFEMRGTGRKRVAVMRSKTVPSSALNFLRDAKDCCKPKAIMTVD